MHRQPLFFFNQVWASSHPSATQNTLVSAHQSRGLPVEKPMYPIFQLHLGALTLLLASAQLQAHLLQIANCLRDMTRARSLPSESPQAEAVKVLDGTHLPHWSKNPWHPQGAMAVHKFSLPDRHALHGLRKLLFSLKCMLCFSRENCVLFSSYLFLCSLSVNLTSKLVIMSDSFSQI